MLSHNPASWFGNVFLRRRKKIDQVSVIILTQNSEERLPLLLERLDGIFSDIIVGVDRKSRSLTFDIACNHSEKVFWIDNPGGIVEETIERLVEHCEAEWVLRIDDDEVISEGVAGFIERYLPTLQVDAVGMHRKWCRVNLMASCLEYSTCPIYGYDWQWRLFRKSGVEFTTRVHTPGIRFLTETRAPLDAFIAHLDWVYHDFGYRCEKVARYESFGEGLGHQAWYLYELDPSQRSSFTPLFLKEFDELALRLGPFQQRTDSLSEMILNRIDWRNMYPQDTPAQVHQLYAPAASGVNAGNDALRAFE